MSNPITTATHSLQDAMLQAIDHGDFGRAHKLLDIIEALTLMGESKNELTSREVDTLKTVGFIDTIKMVRERAGLGLKEAKDLCEDYIAKNNLTRVERPGQSTIYV
jgi:hypothetical protein